MFFLVPTAAIGFESYELKGNENFPGAEEAKPAGLGYRLGVLGTYMATERLSLSLGVTASGFRLSATAENPAGKATARMSTQLYGGQMTTAWSAGGSIRPGASLFVDYGPKGTFSYSAQTTTEFGEFVLSGERTLTQIQRVGVGLFVEWLPAQWCAVGLAGAWQSGSFVWTGISDSAATTETFSGYAVAFTLAFPLGVSTAQSGKNPSPLGPSHSPPAAKGRSKGQQRNGRLTQEPVTPRPMGGRP